MKLALFGPTALQFWRSCEVSPQRLAARMPLPDDFIPSLTRSESSYLQERFGLTGIVQTAAGGSAARRNSQILSCHYAEPTQHYFELVHLGKQLYVSSPEWTILQMASWFAQKLEKEEREKRVAEYALATLAYEFAGTYRLAPAEADGFRPARPLMTTESLRKAFERSSRFLGRKSAGAILDFVIDGSNSPAETQLASFAVFPKTWGGAGLSLPELNARIDTLAKCNKKTRYGDQCWSEAKRIVEYNGGYHEGERANDDDARRNALISLGYSVNVVNSAELHDADMLEELFIDLAGVVGSTGRRPKDYAVRRNFMREVVFETCGTKCTENAGRHVPTPALAGPYKLTRV